MDALTARFREIDFRQWITFVAKHHASLLFVLILALGTQIYRDSLPTTQLTPGFLALYGVSPLQQERLERSLERTIFEVREIEMPDDAELRISQYIDGLRPLILLGNFFFRTDLEEALPKISGLRSELASASENALGLFYSDLYFYFCCGVVALLVSAQLLAYRTWAFEKLARIEGERIEWVKLVCYVATCLSLLAQLSLALDQTTVRAIDHVLNTHWVAVFVLASQVVVAFDLWHDDVLMRARYKPAYRLPDYFEIARLSVFLMMLGPLVPAVGEVALVLESDELDRQTKRLWLLTMFPSLLTVGLLPFFAFWFGSFGRTTTLDLIAKFPTDEVETDRRGLSVIPAILTIVASPYLSIASILKFGLRWISAKVHPVEWISPYYHPAQDYGTTKYLKMVMIVGIFPSMMSVFLFDMSTKAGLWIHVSQAFMILFLTIDFRNNKALAWLHRPRVFVPLFFLTFFALPLFHQPSAVAPILGPLLIVYFLVGAISFFLYFPQYRNLFYTNDNESGPTISQVVSRTRRTRELFEKLNVVVPLMFLLLLGTTPVMAALLTIASFFVIRIRLAGTLRKQVALYLATWERAGIDRFDELKQRFSVEGLTAFFPRPSEIVLVTPSRLLVDRQRERLMTSSVNMMIVAGLYCFLMPGSIKNPLVAEYVGYMGVLYFFSGIAYGISGLTLLVTAGRDAARASLLEGLGDYYSPGTRRSRMQWRAMRHDFPYVLNLAFQALSALCVLLATLIGVAAAIQVNLMSG